MHFEPDGSSGKHLQTVNTLWCEHNRKKEKISYERHKVNNQKPPSIFQH